MVSVRARLLPSFLQVTSAHLKRDVAGPEAASRPFVLTFRPASREGMDDSVVPIGIPAFLKVRAAPGAQAAGCLLARSCGRQDRPGTAPRPPQTPWPVL